MVHRNAPLTETGRLRLARCIVEDGWPNVAVHRERTQGPEDDRGARVHRRGCRPAPASPLSGSYS